METNTIICGDTIEEMSKLPSQSVDMILADLPYGTTKCKWDIIIPFDKLWEQYNRVTKKNAAVVLMATQPFTTKLINSNLDMFKYCWVWDKINRPTGFLNAKKQPLRISEDIVVFYNKQPTYNPQMTDGKPYKATSSGRKTDNYNKQEDNITTICDGKRYPQNIIRLKADERGDVGRIHPTQKPVALFEYLIKTYTNDNELVLDNTAGSCTTAVAAMRTNRQYICIDNSEKYCEIGRQRVLEETASGNK